MRLRWASPGRLISARGRRQAPARRFASVLMPGLAGLIVVFSPRGLLAADGREHSDSDSRYVHHIELYDANFGKIGPDSTQPYSPRKTCGRCHDYEQIAHGWHFNAFDPEAVAGRASEPWIWTDPRIGTQLPLSYRAGSAAYDPRAIGIDRWAMTRQFGGRLPGGNMSEPSQAELERELDGDQPAEAGMAPRSPRWKLSGSLQIDCLVCHAVSGAYDFNARRKQIADENFAWAATAGLHLGKTEGRVSRIKDDADVEAEATQDRLPTVTYDASRFAADGTVFIDLVRQPSNNACYQCHSRRLVSGSGIEPHWVDDEDVHLRAGMKCADCHRNGIDHHITRGYPGEQNPSGHPVATLSCAGCHLGTATDADLESEIRSRPGRMGSPRPAHAGLPPIHFEKLTCTACHGGPIPRGEALRVMTSLAHHLGEKGHRDGSELPAVMGPIYGSDPSGRVTPSLGVWPAFWGTIVDGKVTPIPPARVYDLTRRILRARKGFEEILKPKLSSKELKEILGDVRGRAKQDQWDDDERAKVDQVQFSKGRQLFDQRVHAALESLEQELHVDRAVYVSSGNVYARGKESDSLTRIEFDDDQATQMIDWPIAHTIRPAGWSLGVGGCTECHSHDADLFSSTVQSLGPGPDVGLPISMAALRGIDADDRSAWDSLFAGRKTFKYLIACSILVLSITMLVGFGASVARLSSRSNPSDHTPASRGPT